MSDSNINKCKKVIRNLDVAHPGQQTQKTLGPPDYKVLHLDAMHCFNYKNRISSYISTSKEAHTIDGDANQCHLLTSFLMTHALFKYVLLSAMFFGNSCTLLSPSHLLGLLL